MALKKIGTELKPLYEALGDLRSATPVDHPEYNSIKRLHRDASDMAEEAVENAIDDADANYAVFSDEIKNAIAMIEEAKSDIEKVVKAIAITTRVINEASKLITKYV